MEAYDRSHSRGRKERRIKKPIMTDEELYRWLLQGKRRQHLLLNLKQPMTAKQLARATGMSLDSCSYVLWEFSLYGLVLCLNPKATKSRIYNLIGAGKQFQERMGKEKKLPHLHEDYPEVDWELYGSVCFNHRAAVIRTLTKPMQPAMIKRRAKHQCEALKMSANNVRDVIKYLLKKKLVRAVAIRRRAHPAYELSEHGKKVRELLRRASERPGRSSAERSNRKVLTSGSD